MFHTIYNSNYNSKLVGAIGQTTTPRGGALPAAVALSLRIGFNYADGKP